MPQLQPVDSRRERARQPEPRPLLLTPRQDLRGFLFRSGGRAMLILITSLTILAVLLIFAYTFQMAWPFFQQRGLGELLASKRWTPTHDDAGYGAAAMIYGSFIVTSVAMLIAGPVGLLAAVFLSDIVPFRARQVIKPVIEILASIPSVAFGFFAILVVAPWLQQRWGLPTGANALNAGVLLAVMAVPTIVSISEDALTACGRELREGAYALGSTRAEVLVKVVIPASGSGILAAVMLGTMRAVGETMLVWMAAGAAVNIATPWYNLTESVRTLTTTIAAEMGEAPAGGIHRQALFAVGAMLLAVTFALNMASEYFMARSRRLRQGKASLLSGTISTFRRAGAAVLRGRREARP